MERCLIEKGKKRLEKAKKKLQSAKILLEEKCYDDAVSRAYYAMYHASKAILITRDLDPIKHSTVVSMFGQYMVKEGIFESSYGKNLHHAKDFRERSDYAEDPGITNEDAEEIVKDAQSFIEKVEQVLGEIKENKKMNISNVDRTVRD